MNPHFFMASHEKLFHGIFMTRHEKVRTMGFFFLEESWENHGILISWLMKDCLLIALELLVNLSPQLTLKSLVSHHSDPSIA